MKVCVSDPVSSGFQCFDQRTGLKSFLAYPDSEKYVAFTPGDLQEIINYCKANHK